MFVLLAQVALHLRDELPLVCFDGVVVAVYPYFCAPLIRPKLRMSDKDFVPALRLSVKPKL